MFMLFELFLICFGGGSRRGLGVRHTWSSANRTSQQMNLFIPLPISEGLEFAKL